MNPLVFSNSKVLKILWLSLTILLFLFPHFVTTSNVPGQIHIDYPKVIASGIPFILPIQFSSLTTQNGIWPSNLTYVISMKPSAGVDILIARSSINPYKDLTADGKILLKNLIYGHSTGSHEIHVSFFKEPEVEFPQTSSFLVSSPLSVPSDSTNENFLFVDDEDIYVLPAWISILPSIMTVLLAIILKQNILALFMGVWLGSTFLNGYNPLLGLAKALDTIIIEGIVDTDHASVIYFCLLIGGMIAVVGRGGGAIGMANLVTRFASTRRRGQLATWAIGILIFFDDYASCLIAGTTMKDITGKLNISREKFSFIVDTCAATTASLMIVSSWIGVELNYISDEFEEIGLTQDAYSTFLKTVSYRFYPLMVLFFSFIQIVLDKDFGSMLSAERRAVKTGALIREGSKPLNGSEMEDPTLLPKSDKPKRWFNAAIPFIIVVVFIIGGMMLEGYFVLKEREANLTHQISLAKLNHLSEDYIKDLTMSLSKIRFSISDYFTASSPFHALIWASFLGCFVAITLVICQGILSLSEAMDAWLSGTKSMLFAVLILMHAWGLGNVCKKLYTSDFIARGIGNSLPAGFLPVIVFILAALVSFATGSAWGTMSILFPLMIPLAHSLAPYNEVIMLATISSILSGSVWGNHTSPISDSCIMSSMATGCDHHDHVRTQAVYALVVGFISILFGLIPVGFEIYPSWVGLLVGALVIVFVLVAFGRSPGEDVDGGDPSFAPYPITVILRNYTPFPRWIHQLSFWPPFTWFAYISRSISACYHSVFRCCSKSPSSKMIPSSYPNEGPELSINSTSDLLVHRQRRQFSSSTLQAQEVEDSSSIRGSSSLSPPSLVIASPSPIHPSTSTTHQSNLSNAYSENIFSEH